MVAKLVEGNILKQKKKFWSEGVKKKKIAPKARVIKSTLAVLFMNR